MVKAFNMVHYSGVVSDLVIYFILVLSSKFKSHSFQKKKKLGHLAMEHFLCNEMMVTDYVDGIGGIRGQNLCIGRGLAESMGHVERIVGIRVCDGGLGPLLGWTRWWPYV